MKKPKKTKVEQGIIDGLKEAVAFERGKISAKVKRVRRKSGNPPVPGDNFKRVVERVRAVDARLLATDPRLTNHVEVVHEDGSRFEFHRAFLVTEPYRNTDGTLDYQKTEFVIVFTEHTGSHVFFADDLTQYVQYDPARDDRLGTYLHNVERHYQSLGLGPAAGR